ncbi:MAG: CBS domain-containing protein [Candidatus Lindowbacteria bacterium]|nr:CBS domain-containing protein [Candidatus Lindowbacteria bacterium]
MSHVPAGLVACPACNHHNVPGQDVCEECGNDMHEIIGDGDSLGAELINATVSELESHEAKTVDITATVADAVNVMVEAKYGEVLVTKDGEVTGIFTERDLISKVLSLSKDITALPIHAVMTGSLESVRPTDPIAVAINKMAIRQCRHLPVIEEGKCVGMISVRSIVNYLDGHID